jgi:hypothetical protein
MYICIMAQLILSTVSRGRVHVGYSTCRPRRIGIKLDSTTKTRHQKNSFERKYFRFVDVLFEFSFWFWASRARVGLSYASRCMCKYSSTLLYCTDVVDECAS